MRVLKTIGFDRVWARAEGQYLYDSDGNRFLDMLGGFGMFNAGRNNPRIRAALTETLELDTPGSVQLGVSLLPGLLAEELLKRTPSRLARVLFTSSGAEAIEAALKLGRAATGRSRVVSTEQSFHGLTLGALSAGGDRHFVERFGPLLPGFSRFRSATSTHSKCAPHRGRRALSRRARAGKGVNSRRPAISKAQQLCRRYGTLFAVDEVQTGFGAPASSSPRALGTRADPSPSRSLSRGLRPRRRPADVTAGVRRRVRLARAFGQPRLDLRAERPRDGGGLATCASSTMPISSNGLRGSVRACSS